MLYIILEPRREALTSHLEWHIGEILHLSWPILRTVISIQADGDELEHIRYLFPALTATSGRVVSWFGDIAKTITAIL